MMLSYSHHTVSRVVKCDTPDLRTYLYKREIVGTTAAYSITNIGDHLVLTITKRMLDSADDKPLLYCFRQKLNNASAKIVIV